MSENNFEGWIKPSPEVKPVQQPETFAYVGDIHGDSSETLLPKLQELLQKPPEYLVFMGDIVGTETLERLQQLFYNHVTNHSKTILDKSDTELLAHEIGLDTEKDLGKFTLKDGFIRLRKYELGLEDLSTEEIEQRVSSLSDDEIATEIRRYSKFIHYGHYASNLPEKAKQKLASGLAENATKYIDVMKKFQAKGTQVHVLQGNWDARTPIDFEPGKDDLVLLPEDKKPINIKKLFESEGVNFWTNIDTAETKTSLQIFAPFDGITSFSTMSESEKMTLLEKIADARTKDKTIVLSGHGEPDWEVFNLDDSARKMPSEHQQLIAGYSELIAWTLPDEIVHGHMHFQRLDEEKKPVDHNWKYVMKKLPDGTVQLVRDEKGFESKMNSVVVSYVPWRTFGTLEISTVDPKRGVKGIEGNRDSVNIKD